MDLPVNVSTGMVVGRYIADVIDGPDVNLDPDALPVQGRIVFTASVPYLPNPTAGPDPVTIMRVPIVGVLDQDGYLCTPYPGTLEPQYRGVRLIATDDPDISVTNWTWDVTYLFEPVNGHKLAIPAHGFALPSDGTVDLTKVAKVPSSPGYSLPQAEAAVLRAEEAALTSAQDAANALAAALRSEQAAAATDQGITDMLSDPDTQSGGLLAEMLDPKANADDVAMALADKTGRGEVESLVASKADAAETTEALGAKANQLGVDNALSLKADKSAVATSLADKADLQSGKVPEAQIPARLSETALSITISESIEGSVGTRPEKYGAVGDGVNDDADAIQAWLDAGGTVMGSGNYAISKQLNVSKSKLSYDLSAATIIPLTADITMLAITGADVSIKANLDGLNIARIGIYATGDRPTIHDSIIRNFYSPTLTTRGIEVRTSGEAFTVRNNEIRTIGAQLEGGDAFNSRGVLINASASSVDYGYVTRNVIEDIYGGGAAHIAVNGFISSPIFERVLTVIEGNQLSNSTRRFVKIQANGVVVVRNTVTQESTYSRPLRAGSNIDIITSRDVVVSQNTFTENPLLANIASNGTEDSPCINVSIEGNTSKRDPLNTSAMVSLNRTYGFSFGNNTLTAGNLVLSCGNSKNGVTHSNTLISDHAGSLAFNCNTSNSGMVMHSNQVFANRTSPFINSGTGAQTFNNTTVIPS